MTLSERHLGLSHPALVRRHELPTVEAIIADWVARARNDLAASETAGESSELRAEAHRRLVSRRLEVDRFTSQVLADDVVQRVCADLDRHLETGRLHPSKAHVGHWNAPAWMERARRWADRCDDPMLAPEDALRDALDLWRELDDAQLRAVALERDGEEEAGARLEESLAKALEFAKGEMEMFYPATEWLVGTAAAFDEGVADRDPALFLTALKWSLFQDDLVDAVGCSDPGQSPPSLRRVESQDAGDRPLSMPGESVRFMPRRALLMISSIAALIAVAVLLDRFGDPGTGEPPTALQWAALPNPPSGTPALGYFTETLGLREDQVPEGFGGRGGSGADPIKGSEWMPIGRDKERDRYEKAFQEGGEAASGSRFFVVSFRAQTDVSAIVLWVEDTGWIEFAYPTKPEQSTRFAAKTIHTLPRNPTYLTEVEGAGSFVQYDPGFRLPGDIDRAVGLLATRERALGADEIEGIREFVVTQNGETQSEADALEALRAELERRGLDVEAFLVTRGE